MEDWRKIPAAVALLALLVVGDRAADAQNEHPGALHTVRRPGNHEVTVGDLLQVRYKTQATAAGIGGFMVDLRGDALRRVAVVTAPLDPDAPMLPGAPFWVILFLKAEKPGAAAVRVIPVLNDGTSSRAFEFAATVRDRR